MVCNSNEQYEAKKLKNEVEIKKKQPSNRWDFEQK